MSDWLARAATRRAHVLLVEVPGAWRVRAGVEQHVVRRGWRLAESPADADVLAVCGLPGPELSRVVDAVWDLMPGPRVRADVHDRGRIDAALAQVGERLIDTAHHRQDAAARPIGPALGEHAAIDHGMEHREHGGMDHGGMDHGGMEHGDMDMAPAGIPLATGGEDRDGLEMDVLHLRLGPVLPHWPAGLVLRCALQGDVVVDAEVSLLDSGGGHGDQGGDASAGDTRLDAARRCDNVAGMLVLAGWEDAAAAARRVRDMLLDDTDQDQTVAALGHLRRKVGRSRLMRWSLRNLRPLGAEELRHHGIPGHLRGDTHDRLLAMIERAQALASSPATTQRPDRPSISPGALTHLVTGLDLAAARLVVASLDLDPFPAHHAVHHG